MRIRTVLAVAAVGHRLLSDLQLDGATETEECPRVAELRLDPALQGQQQFACGEQLDRVRMAATAQDRVPDVVADQPHHRGARAHGPGDFLPHGVPTRLGGRRRIRRRAESLPRCLASHRRMRWRRFSAWPIAAFKYTRRVSRRQGRCSQNRIQRQSHGSIHVGNRASPLVHFAHPSQHSRRGEAVYQ